MTGSEKQMTATERAAKLVVEQIQDNRQMGVFTNSDWIEEQLRESLIKDGIIKPVEVIQWQSVT